MDDWTVVVWVSTGLDVLLLAWALQRPNGRLPAIGVAAMAWLFKAGVLFALTRDPFGLMHLIYLDLVVVAPVLALLLLVQNRGWLPPGASFASLLVAVAPALFGGYATFVEPYRLQVETADVSLVTSRSGQEPLRVGILSDVQTRSVTDYERSAVNRLLALEPDLILITGDLLQAQPGDGAREIPAYRDLLRRLHAPGGVYAVLGDVDRPEEVAAMVAGTDVRLLVNEVVRTRVRDRQVAIGGVEVAYGSPSAVTTMSALEGPGDEDVRLLLAHRPDAALALREGTRVDLVVAGHTHGGQVVLPYFGPPMTLSHVPRVAAAGGLHELDGGRRLYVSRGVGLERGRAPQVRFLCPPDVSLITLRSGA